MNEEPTTEEKKFFVYGFWHCNPTKDIVEREGKPDIQEFENIDDALNYIRSKSEKNVNITWCLLWDSWEVEKIKNIGF